MGAGGIFPELLDNSREPERIPLTNSSLFPQAPPPQLITALLLLPTPPFPTFIPKPLATTTLTQPPP